MAMRMPLCVNYFSATVTKISDRNNLKEDLFWPMISCSHILRENTMRAGVCGGGELSMSSQVEGGQGGKGQG